MNAERLVLLGWSRAILLQLAHPLVAAGVADHSTFRDGPLARARRLHHTVRSMVALTFGDAVGRETAIEGIKAIHRRVNGKLGTAVGRFATGTPYSAEDPGLLLWVHATLVESILLVYAHLVAPLEDADRDAYCAEAARIAVALGARETEVPTNWVALSRYLEAMYASGTLAVGPEARELGFAVLSPPFGLFAAPVVWANRLVSVGFLHPDIRQQYGFAWRRSDDQRLHRLIRFVHGTRRLLPAQLAWWPEARHGRSEGRP